MRVMLALLFLLCAYVAPSASSADEMPTAKEIRDRSAAAAGPVPENYRETIQIGGDFKRVTYHLGAEQRQTFDHNGLHSEQGTYHGEAWEQGNNGLTVISEKDPGNAIKDPISTTVTHVTQPFDAYVIAELNARGAGRRTYYDSTTFQRRRVDDVSVDETTTETVDAFATFGDRTLPKRWTVISQRPHEETPYERVEYVAGVTTDADVQEPPTRRMLVEFPPGVDRVDLPITRIGNQFFVRVSVGSKLVDFALDTGSSRIVIDPELARDLGVHLINRSAQTTAQRYVGAEAIIPEMRVGSLRMHDIAVYGAPLSEGSGIDVKVLGLLGFDFLAQLGVTIDYQHNSVHVMPAEKYVPPAEQSTYPFDVRLGALVPMVTVTIPDAVAERAIIDTGCSCTFAFFDYFARRYPKAFQHGMGYSSSYGVGGRVASELFRFHEIHLGPILFNDGTGMRFSPHSYSYNADGLIGNNLLSLFTLDLDYLHGRIYLTPNAAARHAQESR